MKRILVRKDDYLLMSNFIEAHRKDLSNYNFKRIYLELLNADVIKEENLPSNVIGPNSTIKVQELGSNRKAKIKLVLPNISNPGMSHISIFSPIGIALIGYQEGESVEWEIGGKIRTFQILSVSN